MQKSKSQLFMLAVLMMAAILNCSAYELKSFGTQKYIKKAVLTKDGSIKISFVPLDFDILKTKPSQTENNSLFDISNDKSSSDNFLPSGNQYSISNPKTLNDPPKKKEITKIQDIATKKVQPQKFKLNSNIDEVIQKRLFSSEKAEPINKPSSIDTQNKGNIRKVVDKNQTVNNSSNGNYGEQNNDIKGKQNWIGGKDNKIRGDNNFATKYSDENQIYGTGNFVHGSGNVIYSN